MTGLRFPDQPGEDEACRQRQREYIRAHRGQFMAHAEKYVGDSDIGELYEDIKLHAKDTHPKKELRMREVLDRWEYGTHVDRTWLKHISIRGQDTPVVVYKAKKDETAKYNKYIRMIGDLGVGASLIGFRATGFLKKAQAKCPFETPNGVLEFVSTPDEASLEGAFENAINPPGRMHYSYFSDDGLYSVRLSDGGVRKFNVDIKTCDASHTGALFDLYTDMTPGHLRPAVEILVEQCAAPFEIQNPTPAFRNEKIVLQYPEARMYSGSTLTTSLNNLANQLIGLCLSEDCPTTADEIIRSAARSGYVVTVEACENDDQMQFLKHSYVRDVTGERHALLNLGVLLRSMGACKGDYPGRSKTPWDVRAEGFVRAVTYGMYPRVHFPVRDSIIERFPLVDMPSHVLEKHIPYNHTPGDAERSYSDASLAARYGLSDEAMHELTHHLSAARAGDRVNCVAAHRILFVDYGLCQELGSQAW